MPVRSGSLHDEVAVHKGMAIALEVVGAERGRGQVAPVLLGDRPGERTAHPIPRVKIRSPGNPTIPAIFSGKAGFSAGTGLSRELAYPRL